MAIRNSKTIKVYEGNTCYCGTDKCFYDCYDIVMSRDEAWELAKRLLDELKCPDGETVTVRAYEEVPEDEK